MKKLFSIFTILIFITGCSSQSAENETDQLSVSTTIFPLYDFTKKIGGDEVEVTTIYPPNVDAHSYEPSSKDMVEMASESSFIYSGIGFESSSKKIAESLEKEGVKIIATGENLSLLKNNEEEHQEDESHEEESHHHDVDPHIWLDPVLAIELAENIKNGLIELNPESEEIFEENFQLLKDDLEALDQQFKEVVNEAPQNKFLVAHGAYGYWEKRYGIEQINVLGLSPNQEPSQKSLQEIIETSQGYDFKYMIFENNVSNEIAEVVQQSIGAETLTLYNLESVTEEQFQNEDYFSLMKKNLKTLSIALQNK
ncbi:zinc ABC transporter substrate-binding protein [Bacillus carboniphilus]|uniref:Zinc ABC transporter substrate-binding protein n=1 Tax=Bacillus carboniphilus TaxID=86663 RepID=A0ABY9JPF0_9BACI|nr:zinc ABC transporter substrate-binding protein [Bacillus carboniphilus]WLR41187.1 zinc ABC transporter substrate-binding protein [Bacillus carboniphilus]